MPAPAPSLAPIVLGQRAIRPVPAFGSVWVASAAEGTVQRIDPATGAITATITVADPQRLLAAGCAPSSEHAFATGSFGLRACDAPSAIAAGGGSIWAVANGFTESDVSRVQAQVVYDDQLDLDPLEGVDVKRFTPLSEPGEVATFGFVGRLLEDKGIRTLIAAHRMLRTRMPASSKSSRATAASSVSPTSTKPASAEYRPGG